MGKKIVKGIHFDAFWDLHSREASRREKEEKCCACICRLRNVGQMANQCEAGGGGGGGVGGGGSGLAIYAYATLLQLWLYAIVADTHAHYDLTSECAQFKSQCRREWERSQIWISKTILTTRN